MHDAVINNHQLFYSYENLVQKHEKRGNTIFFSWFSYLVWKWEVILLFQHIINADALMRYHWSDFGNEHTEQLPNFELITALKLNLALLLDQLRLA